MKDQEILDRIRKSADEIRIPSALEPKSVMTNLGDNRHAKNRRLSAFRIAAGTAALLALAVAVWAILSQTDVLTPTADSSSTIEVHHTAGASAAESESTTEDGETDRSEAVSDAALTSIQDYGELYEALLTDMETINVDSDIELAAEATEDSASVSSSSDTGASGRSYSSTNTRTDGIDEGDIVKTNGSLICTLDEGQEIHMTDADSMELLSTIPSENYEETMEEIYLEDELLIVISSGMETALGETASASAWYVETADTSTVYFYDISDPSAPTLTGQISQSGSYTNSRLCDNYLYLFTCYYPLSTESEEEINLFVPEVNESTLSTDSIYIPETLSSTASLVVSSIDVTQPDSVTDSKMILSGADTYYVSDSHIFMCNTSWDSAWEEHTQIVSFAYQDGMITAQAAGSIRGYLNDSFSLDEYDGYLRAVSTCWSSDDGIYTNFLSVLDEDLETVGQITDLAKDETIRSARFIGETGYFVTYRETDPLFSVDLSDPQNPVILGELKVTGFSGYLHAYGENLLLGIGWETDEDTGDTLGLKLSMFDISDPSDVQEKTRLIIEDVYDCPALDNYKAVMIDTEANLFGFAYLSDNNNRDVGNYTLFSYDAEQGFQEIFTYCINNDFDGQDYIDANSVRGLYIGDTFYISTKQRLSAFAMSSGYTLLNSLSW